LGSRIGYTGQDSESPHSSIGGVLEQGNFDFWTCGADGSYGIGRHYCQLQQHRLHSELRGLLLTINVNSTPPGAAGTLPNGAISGDLSTSESGATILFSPNNTTTSFGTLPGVVISGGGESVTYQVLNPTLGLEAPTVGNPIGQTSIQGDMVAATATPEPTMFLFLLGTGLAMGGVVRVRRTP
jgi:hypothetical protein